MDKLLEGYWQSIPVGRESAITYPQLEMMWRMDARQVRKMLAALSGFDNGDNYILIRSSTQRGFYRTDDPEDIAAYGRECRSRATKTFAPLKKINRVLRSLNAADGINCSLFNNIQNVRRERGMSQLEVCRRLHLMGIVSDVGLLSKIENGYAMPTPAQLSAMAVIFGCEPFELVAMERDGLEIYAAQESLQVP